MSNNRNRIDATITNLRCNKEIRILRIYADHPSMRQTIKGAIQDVLERSGYNQCKAAKAVGIPRTTFRDWLSKYDLI